MTEDAPRSKTRPAALDASRGLLPAAMLAGGVAALALAWWGAPVTVTLDVDGEARELRTRAGRVGQLLLDEGLELREGDLVSPALGARIERGARVRVRRGRDVRVRADGAARRLASHARTPAAILQEAGVPLGPRDRVLVGGAPWRADRPLPDEPRLAGSGVLVADAGARPIGRPVAPDSGAPASLQDQVSDLLPALPGAAAPSATEAEESAELRIDVVRAQTVVVDEEGVAFELETAGATVAEALANAGIVLWPGDRVQPPADSPFLGVSRISLRRATPFVVSTDRSLREARAYADTVGEALEASGLGLRGRDYAIPDATSRLERGMEVRVVRVAEDVLVQQVDMPFGYETQPDDGMDLDTQRVVRAGQPGRKTQHVRIIYENGEEIGREVIEEHVEVAPVNELIAYGTNIVWRTVDTPEGPKRYWRKMRMYATSYSASRAGTPVTAPWYGITRLGLKMRKGIVAVDPNVIPLGTNLFVPDYGVGLAGDTGGGVRNYHLDLGFDDDNYQSWHSWVEAYLLEPLPPASQIRWILP